VATQVTMEDGTESPLVDHMRNAHQKGTRGLTEEYLANLHLRLHQHRRGPEEELEHRHPGVAARDEGDTEVPEDELGSGGANRSRGRHRKTRA
jgi:hypothetical protein